MKPGQKSICALCGSTICWDGSSWQHTDTTTFLRHFAGPKLGGQPGPIRKLVEYLIKVIDEGRSLPAEEAEKLREEAQYLDNQFE